jgi:hypothetical protein
MGAQLCYDAKLGYRVMAAHSLHQLVAPSGQEVRDFCSALSSPNSSEVPHDSALVELLCRRQSLRATVPPALCLCSLEGLPIGRAQLSCCFALPPTMLEEPHDAIPTAHTRNRQMLSRAERVDHLREVERFPKFVYAFAQVT